LSGFQGRRNRPQEFVLRWLQRGTGSWKDFVRQQWNLNPSGSIDEGENYPTNVAGATALELTIKPDMSGGEAHASLQ
jgi:hypothetical protein